MNQYKRILESNEIIKRCFNDCYDNAIRYNEDGSVFVITGDIPAMWLRDSSAQVMPYLYFLDELKYKKLIKDVLNKQFAYICIDPYANAFKNKSDDYGEWDNTDKSDKLDKIVWERKFELDSLCYPLFLLSKYIEFSNDYSVLNATFFSALDKILNVVENERQHSKKSNYFFKRKITNVIDQCVGLKTNQLSEKGLVWSGFRPSDDCCKYCFHIPDNIFLVGVLSKLIKIFKIANKKDYIEKCQKIVNELSVLINQYGIIYKEGFGKIYVSETDCLGHYLLDDDANIPSLLSLPYLESPIVDEQIYKNTRKYILGKTNKYYFEGKELKGIGSPHTKVNFVWPLSIIMQGLTSEDADEIRWCFKQVLKTIKGKYLIHESVDSNDLNNFSREWFNWANSLFVIFVFNKINVLNL